VHVFCSHSWQFRVQKWQSKFLKWQVL